MRIGLVVHGHLKHAQEYAARAAALLASMGVETMAEDGPASVLPGVTSFSSAAHAPDALVSLGGDGTILRGVQYAVQWNVPLLGVNLGRKGFLAEIEPQGLEDALKRLIAGEYTLEERPLLSVSFGGGRWHALNDVVVSRGGYARLIGVTTLVDGEMAGRYLADGVIVATPTGSTGYSLSAGGPVVSPRVDCMVVTPVCAHSLQHRPCVVGGSSVIRLELDSDEEQTASLQVDGQSRAELTAGMSVEISRSEEKVRFVRVQPEQFFGLVRGKLAEWSQ
ncbi:MAG: NAD(+)/NADH kinase [Christensenellaceae bacterium]|nr:NAD(+)/NADH kinase [Christensenellaceae bacterium]